MSNKIKFENGSIIESIDNIGQTIRGKIRGTYIDTEEKKPFFEGYRPPYYFKSNKENFDLNVLSQITQVAMDDYAKHTSKLEDMQINIGSILLVNKDGINKEYQVLDNSEMNPEYPFALLDMKKHRIVQTSVSLDYMNFGHYIYIDKEYEIINIR